MIRLPHATALVTAVAGFFAAGRLPAQAPALPAPADSALGAYVATVRAVDAHAHPMRPVAPGAPPDTEYDALPLDGIPPFALPARLRPEHPAWRAARRALYGLTAADTGPAVAAAAARVQAREGARFPAWALDQAGVDVMLANRVAMGPGLDAPRFRWVTFVDALMLPLDVRGEAARSPDVRPLYPREAALLRRYLRDLKLAALPPTLDDYVRRVVGPTLDRQWHAGAVSVKFEAAYLRPLDFDDPDPALARRVYARYAAGGTPPHAEYKALQDYLFREIARAAGRRGMAVQIHVLELFGGFYSPRGSAPHLLEPALNDSSLRGTNFVLVHGGWPLVAETQGLLAKPNVYADVSMMDLVAEPAVLAGVLRPWLGEWPEKVLYGSDAFDGGPGQGWEQGAWVAAATARRGLTLALTGMLRDGEVDRARAEQIARMVLRENARAAYPLLR
ncbi:hypothetical protein tb265_06440 [Gemmatimonadetes bacterium T265]|nr:hypothetical protein tb265_06440 [Gemmatimonadetes bacterium T265]